MTRIVARLRPKERSAGQGAPSQSIFDSRNEQQGSEPGALGQGEHRRKAAEYRLAATRNAEAGRELGGSQGFALISLAEHFACRARQHAIAAEGSNPAPGAMGEALR